MRKSVTLLMSGEKWTLRQFGNVQAYLDDPHNENCSVPTPLSFRPRSNAVPDPQMLIQLRLLFAKPFANPHTPSLLGGCGGAGAGTGPAAGGVGAGGGDEGGVGGGGAGGPAGGPGGGPLPQTSPK